MFNSTTLKLLGNCTIQLTNPVTQAKYKVGFMVIGCDEGANLIGSRAALLMRLVDVHYDNIKSELPVSESNAQVHSVMGRRTLDRHVFAATIEAIS